MGVGGGESLDGGLPDAAAGSDWDCTLKPGGIVSWAPLEAKGKGAWVWVVASLGWWLAGCGRGQ